MNLYEIDTELNGLMNEMLFDEETGELVEGAEAMIERIDALQMERTKKLNGIAKYILNLRAESNALKAEEERLKKRRDRVDKKEQRLLEILKTECAGQKTVLDVATVSYSKSEAVDIYDRQAAIEWLAKTHNDCLRYKEPEVSKSDVKKLIKSGADVPGITIVQNQNCLLK